MNQKFMFARGGCECFTWQTDDYTENEGRSSKPKIIFTGKTYW